MSAMSGGFPPCTAVARTVGTLLPAEVYLTWTFGYCWLKALITAWNAVCSGPVQMPTNEIDPDTELVEPPLLDDPLELPPQATATAATAAKRTNAWVRW